MTIDERVEQLMTQLPYLHKTEGGVVGFHKTEGGVASFKEKLRLALLDAMKDQRHVCAETVLRVISESRQMPSLPLAYRHLDDELHQAVINSEVK